MKLTGIKYIVFVLLLTFLLSLTRGDVEVSCVFMESCILPCSFQPGPDVVIHWIQEEPQKTPVHSYYHNQDQLTGQGQHFKNRTSLFQDQISRGNASLQLTGAKVQDQGKYQCYTSTETGEKTFIILKVEAPVSKVVVQQEGNRITCSSEGIYPEPELTWSTNPPSNVTFKNSTTVQQTEQQLYNINSSLTVSDGLTGLDYSCTVSTDTNKRTVTLLKSNKPPNVREESKVGIIVGVVVAILVLALTVGLAVYCTQKKNKKNPEPPIQQPDAADSGHELKELNPEAEGGQREEESDEETQPSLQDAEG